MGLFDRRKKEKEEQKIKSDLIKDTEKQDEMIDEKLDSEEVIELEKEVETIEEKNEDQVQEEINSDKKQENKEKPKKEVSKKARVEKKVSKSLDDEDDEEDNEEENDTDVDVKALYNPKMLNKLKMASDRIDKYYSDFRNLVLSYEKIRIRSNNACDVYLLNGKPIIKINVFQRSLKVHYALKPSDYPVNKYHHKDVKDVKKYEMVPMQLKVSSDRAYKYASEILDVLTSKYKLNKKTKIKEIDYTQEASATSKDLLEIQGLSSLLKNTCSIEEIDVLSDSAAKHCVVLETLKSELPPLSERIIAEVTIGELTAAFKSSYVIDLDLLKAIEIVEKEANYLRVIPGGRSTRAITVKANDFDLDVVKMMVITGGNVIKLIP